MKRFVLLMAVVVAGCDPGGSTTTAPATGPGATGQQLKEDLQKVGQDLKEVGHEAETQLKPAWDKTKEEARNLVHRAAEKVAEKTATEPQ